MFDIGGLELLIIAVVGLLVIGPERLPETLRTLGLWLGRLRRSFVSVKSEIEKEIGMDEVRRQLHNEAIMDQMKQIERDVKGTAEQIDPKKSNSAPTTTPPALDSQDDDNSPSHDATREAEPAQQSDEHRIDGGIAAAEDGHADAAEPEPIRPRSEAELEAAHMRRARSEKSS